MASGQAPRSQAEHMTAPSSPCSTRERSCRPSRSPYESEQKLDADERAKDLSPNFGDGRSRSGGGGYGLTVGRLGDDLDPVVECHTENEFWQLVVAIETTPAFMRGLKQFEDHRECRLLGEAALRSEWCGGARWRRCFRYYGRPHNYPALNGFYRELRRTWMRCLRRRSQKSRRMGWSEFETLTARFRLPVPRITRTWAQARI
ncbi:hypothetical protein ACVWWP_007406 [Bradyrhizobium sp. LM3.6]